MWRRQPPAPALVGTVPAALLRYVEADWYDPAEPVQEERWPYAASDYRRVYAYTRWRAARRAWATGHGYDVDCPHGEKPDRDIDLITSLFLQ